MRLTIALGLVGLLIPVTAEAHESSDSWASAIPLGIGLAFAVVLYVHGLIRWRRRGVRVPAGQVWAALLGAAVATAVLLPPLDRAASVLLSAHMIQHTSLILVAAPLLALAHPATVVVAALPSRSPLGWLRRLRPAPVSAWAAHGLALWVWHLPPLYGLALRMPVLHALEHASLLATAVLFWWALGRPGRRLAGALLVFTLGAHMSVLGALMALSPRPWFAAHAEGGHGLTGLEDQQLAGLVMWVPAGTLLTVIVLAMLARWFAHADRRSPWLGPPPGESALIVGFVLLGLAAAGCDATTATAVAIAGGDPVRGRTAIRTYGCHTCHTIPGVAGASAVVGPSLAHLAVRGYVAGQPNAPDHLVRWLRQPQHVRPDSPMPEMGVTERDARDIVTYLYTLR